MSTADVPVGQAGRVGAHRPVEGVGGVHRGRGGTSPLRPSSALRSWRPGAPGPRPRGGRSPSRAVRRASRRRPPGPTRPRRAPRARPGRRGGGGWSGGGCGRSFSRGGGRSGGCRCRCGGCGSGCCGRRNGGGCAATGAPTATGTAGGATTTGAACEMSTSRRGSAWPGRTRSARTTLRPSSSFANRGAYRMYITIRNSTVATPRRVSSCAMLNTHPPVFSTGVVEGSTGVCAPAVATVETMNTQAPASTTRSRRDVFIERIVATTGPHGNRPASNSGQRSFQDRIASREVVGRGERDRDVRRDLEPRVAGDGRAVEPAVDERHQAGVRERQRFLAFVRGGGER